MDFIEVARKPPPSWGRMNGDMGKQRSERPHLPPPTAAKSVLQGFYPCFQILNSLLPLKDSRIFLLECPKRHTPVRIKFAASWQGRYFFRIHRAISGPRPDLGFVDLFSDNCSLYHIETLAFVSQLTIQYIQRLQ
jgi:hypothetical protein